MSNTITNITYIYWCIIFRNNIYFNTCWVVCFFLFFRLKRFGNSWLNSINIIYIYKLFPCISVDSSIFISYFGWKSNAILFILLIKLGWPIGALYPALLSLGHTPIIVCIFGFVLFFNSSLLLGTTWYSRIVYFISQSYILYYMQFFLICKLFFYTYIYLNKVS